MSSPRDIKVRLRRIIKHFNLMIADAEDIAKAVREVAPLGTPMRTEAELRLSLWCRARGQILREFPSLAASAKKNRDS